MKVGKILVKTLKINKIGKIAFCGASKIQRVIVNFVDKAVGKDNSKTLNSKEEAII